MREDEDERTNERQRFTTFGLERQHKDRMHEHERQGLLDLAECLFGMIHDSRSWHFALGYDTLDSLFDRLRYRM